MNNQLIELLQESLLYVYGAYECAFPDEDANIALAYKIEKAILENGGKLPLENQGPRYYNNPSFSYLYE